MLRPFRFYLLLIGLILIVAVAAYWYGNQQVTVSQNIIANLQQQVTSLSKLNDKLSRQFNILTVELAVARMANTEIQGDMQQYLSHTNELKKQLSFYQQVLAPELDADGFEVFSVDIVPRQSDGYFEVTATLMQKQKNNRSIIPTFDSTKSRRRREGVGNVRSTDSDFFSNFSKPHFYQTIYSDIIFQMYF